MAGNGLEFCGLANYLHGGTLNLLCVLRLWKEVKEGVPVLRSKDKSRTKKEN